MSVLRKVFLVSFLLTQIFPRLNVRYALIIATVALMPLALLLGMVAALSFCLGTIAARKTVIIGMASMAASSPIAGQ